MRTLLCLLPATLLAQHWWYPVVVPRHTHIFEPMSQETIPGAADIQPLVEIMNRLRSECPWDKKQTIQTLRQLTIEETYELAEAIQTNDWASIKEELGDLLLHLVFYSTIAREQQAFTLQDVIDGICKKLIDRHPHIYGDVEANDAETVKQNWEKLKLREGKKGVLAGVPAGLPALVKAIRIQSKAKTVGFEWDTAEQVWEKVQEETAELQEAEQTGNADRVEEEFGDLMFSLVNYARFIGVDAEAALEKTNQKFIRRFNAMEQEALKAHKQLTDMSLEEMDAIWNRIKHQ